MTNDLTTINGLKELVAKFEAELKDNESYKGLKYAQGLLAVLSKTSTNAIKTSAPVGGDSYSSAFTQIQKAVYFLRRSDSPLTTAEIVDRIIQQEPTLEKRKVSAGLSAVLGDYAKRNKVVKRDTNKNGELVYSLI